MSNEKSSGAQREKSKRLHTARGAWVYFELTGTSESVAAVVHFLI